MNLEIINSTLFTLWDMLHIYLPLFILIGVFQTAVSLYALKNIFFTKKRFTTKEVEFLRSLDDFNDRSSDIVLVLAFIGTVFGMILALYSLSEAWGVSDAQNSQAGLKGAAIALTSTLGGLFFARLWGQHLNDALFEKVFKKFHLRRKGSENEYVLDVLDGTHDQIEQLVKLVSLQTELIKALMNQNTIVKEKTNSKTQMSKKSNMSNLDRDEEYIEPLSNN
jgi:hypothetical protein